MEKFPEARHYVIGHSHGGNVAMYALGDGLRCPPSDGIDPNGARAAGVLRERISGVVCLATPFLVRRVRDLGSNQRELLTGAAVVFILTGIFLGNRLSATASVPGWVHALVPFVIGVLSAVIVLLLFQSWQRFGQELIRQMTFPGLDRDKLLILRSPADEASAGMAFGQILCQIGVLLFRWMWRTHARLEKAAEALSRRRLKLLGLALGTMVGYVTVCFLAAVSWQHANTWMKGVLIGALLLSVSAAVGMVFLFFRQIQMATFVPRLITLAMIWPLILLLAAITLLPFGWQIALASVFLDVTAEPVPPGCWKVHQFEPPRRNEAEQDNLSLMHSVIYENPDAIEAVCDWIEAPVVERH
jgi:hypothetical protein